MYPTTEVRWFVPGPVPDEAQLWFEGLGWPVEMAERTDRYLVPASADEPGIKLREGLIEVKARTAVLGVEHLAPSVDGVSETFRKWSFPLAEAPPTPSAGWIDVAKTRRLRTYTQEIADAAEGPEIGCSVELGEVRLGDGVWWTVCLEAFGSDEAARLNIIRKTAKRVFYTITITLDLTQSVGYVGWLVRSME